MSAAALIEHVRPEVLGLPPYNAGLSTEYVQAKYGVARVAKLGSNENPLGPSEAVARALQASAASVALYPDPSCTQLRDALATHLDCAPERLVFGNGSEDLIAIAAHALLAPGAEVVTIVPSFGLHILYPVSVGATVRAVKMRDDFSIDVDSIIAALTPNTRMVLISNPSNPVGVTIAPADMMRLFAAIGPETLLVWDEAYYEYAAADPGYADCFALLRDVRCPWLVLRTFSKAYALAGLRIGYGVASSPAVVDVLNRVRTPFNVNRLAQVAALAALDDTDHLARSVAHVVAERERMRSHLQAIRYVPAPSAGNFLFFDAHEDATALAERLLGHGVIVKAWREAGYTQCLRVSVGSRIDNDLFLTALADVARVGQASRAA
ncbi:histidinol phosphate aminotransferase [Pandoraea terrae]|uniref:Histidinol-phosphate aminotransferase n=1 Tax=Pandoraea terrae TaxID=1537710 RepID=A0A5E4RTI5_9BURK|nr:histidinol-phosphate transaminase [Pandoraea terrae]VVD65712.1 histidinol phosphate aminotransferase [Pandoraea terrae]